MRKTFLKTLVATAVVGATVALGSVFAFAGTTSYTMSDLGSFSSNTAFTIGDGLTASFNQSKTEDKTFGDETFTGCVKLNKKELTEAPDYDKDVKDNSIIYDGKKGDTVSLIVKGNGIPYTIRVTEDFSTFTDLGSTASSKADLEEMTYTLKADGKAYFFAYNQQNAFVYKISVTTKDEEEQADGFKKLANGNAVYVAGNDTYLIAAVSSLDADSVTIKVGTTQVGTKKTNTVYQNVEINGETINAQEKLGVPYLYAVKLVGANGNAAAESFTVE